MAAIQDHTSEDRAVTGVAAEVLQVTGWLTR